MGTTGSSRPKRTKPKVQTRPAVIHGGKRIEIPLLSGPVGTPHDDLKAKYPIFNAAGDVAVIDYYLGQLAEIKFLAVNCDPLLKPGKDVQQAAEAVSCWDTNRNGAIRAFQQAMRIRDADEVKYGIVKPDGETLKALVDYGDLAEQLDALRDRKTNPYDFLHSGGFDQQKFKDALEARKKKNLYFQVRFNSSTAGAAWTLVELMQADPLILDLRWMAYMLATAFWEASHTITKTIQVPKLDANKKPVLDQKNQPVMVSKDIKVWEVMVPIDEIAPSKTRRYKAPVKVKQITADDMAAIRKLSPKIADLTGGAWIVEKDGDQFLVAPDGKQVWQSARAAMGADYAAQASRVYQAAEGSEFAYHGRGYVQLTWWGNYVSTGVAIGEGLNLLFDPEKAKQPAIAYKVMSHGMRTGDGFANGFKFSDHFYGEARNYTLARRMVNGSDHAKEIAAIAVLFEEMLLEAKR